MTAPKADISILLRVFMNFFLNTNILISGQRPHSYKIVKTVGKHIWGKV